MEREAVIAGAAAPTIEVVRGVAPDQLHAPTPCADFTVRRLVNHLLFWAPLHVGAALKQPAAPPATSEDEVDLTSGDWAAKLEDEISRMVDAWSDRSAWEGETRFAGPDATPAALLGGMACAELLIHGWDLARATDQKPDWDDEVVAFVHAELVATAELGREMGAYGPEVAVPEAAPLLDRTLGLSGRNPDWEPSPR
jgi:uncharacterized protein (TIGR03086 family)